MIQQTVQEQERALYWHRRRRQAPAARGLLRETDQILYWVEECLVQDMRLVPGWVMPRLMLVLAAADSGLPQRLGRERRPVKVLDLIYEAQAKLMERSCIESAPARIIPLFA